MTSTSQLAAQPVGSPVFTASKREFTLSLNAGYLRKKIHGIENTSRRFLGKAIYGLTNSFDVFGEFGITKLQLDTNQAPEKKFHDKYRLAFGGGFTWRFLNCKKAKFYLFFNGQIFRFTGKPSIESITDLTGMAVNEKVELDYDWRETIFVSGFSKSLGFLNIFSGIHAKNIQRVETKTTIFSITDGTRTQNSQNGEYKSGMQINPLLGIEFMLPSRFKINLEIIGHSKSEFLFNVGISQTGKPT